VEGECGLEIFMAPRLRMMTEDRRAETGVQHERENEQMIRAFLTQKYKRFRTDTCHGLRVGRGCYCRWSFYDRLFGFLFEEQPLHGDVAIVLVVAAAVTAEIQEQKRGAMVGKRAVMKTSLLELVTT
jgi:hypothetical protein